MGLYDRDYTQDDYGTRYAPQMGYGFGGVTTAVKWLLIINGVVFLTQWIWPKPVSPSQWDFLDTWFSVYPTSWQRDLQLWRLVTYQFMHGSPLHILLNMLGLFFLGPTLERHWGTRRFLGFYLGCGIAGGLTYILLAGLKVLIAAPLLGASGAILGLLAACAILFPHFVVILIIFPVPIRVAAVILIFLAVAAIVGHGVNAGGEAAHLGGMAAGAVYALGRARIGAWTSRLRIPWPRHRRPSRLSREEDLEKEVDRILQKVHRSGIHSLTWREKATLRKATETEQQRSHR
jgi:membrane associated rhomboid family serine protease